MHQQPQKREKGRREVAGLQRHVVHPLVAPAKPLDLTLELAPKARFDVVDLRSHFAEEHKAIGGFPHGADQEAVAAMARGFGLS